jgi:3',5'-cyclic AMP phosphodiesterase CpdA
MPESLNIAHLSDLHFAKFSWDPSQIFSKRWIGNLNLLFSRRKKSGQANLPALIELLKSLETHLVIITGDLTTTSLKKEYQLAQNFLHVLSDQGIKVVVIPGNHDHYTKEAYREKHFYEFFPSTLHTHQETHSLNLKEHALAIKPLTQTWWLIALDTALSTSLISSRGLFSKALEDKLKETLSHIPNNHKVIIANHFPFFTQDSPRKILARGNALKETLKQFPQVKLYIHGHTHRSSLADLRGNHLPIILDSGSTGMLPRQSWNRLLLKEEELTIQQFELQNSHWQAFRTETFSF